MAFYGVFIGVNRHSSTLINELSFACRDATALHALFTDALGGTTTLLTDEKATRATILDELSRLNACSEDDVVVISFSGHGAPSHQIVTYDADLRDLENSCLSLNSLARSLSSIPARRLICILDCCFSGGMGAKGLDEDTTPRDLSSVENALAQMSGAGRLILTASTATEKAWENGRLRHGLLTHYLLGALQGAEEVVKEGKISLYRLLEHVTRRVIDFSAKLGKPQNPTIRGKIDGDITWPVFAPGALYRALFPESVIEPATPDIQSLGSHGFPQELLDAWAGVIPSLNQLQVDAINDYGLLAGEHLVVSAPTSSGKTMIGELAALKGALDRQRAFFLLPLKALVNDKQRHFERLYGDFGIRTIKVRVLQNQCDWVKDLIDKSKRPFVFAGMPWAANILRNPENEQLSRRITIRLEITPFGWTGEEQSTVFRAFLKTLEGQLPLPDRSRLASRATAFRVFCATNGRVGKVMNLVRRAAELAVLNEASCIDLTMLRTAYDDRLRAEHPNRINPFDTVLESLRPVPFEEYVPSLEGSGRGRTRQERASRILKK